MATMKQPGKESCFGDALDIGHNLLVTAQRDILVDTDFIFRFTKKSGKVSSARLGATFRHTFGGITP